MGEQGEHGRTRVVVADDHPIFLEGLSQVLSRSDEVELVGRCCCGREAIDAVKSESPDVLISDVEMPDIGGLEIARWRRAEGLSFGMVILTMHRDRQLFSEALGLGVSGYVLKECVTDDILECVRTVKQGRVYLSPALTPFLAERHGVASVGNPVGGGAAGVGALTASERRVLRLIASDMTTKEIAAELGISPRTVDNHRANMCRKLELSGSHSLLKFAFDHRDRLAD